MSFGDFLKLTMPNLPLALCADPTIPPDTFHPDGKLGLYAVLPMVRKLCAQCPERTPCLEFALTNQEEEGLWAGTTPDERRKLANGKMLRRQGNEVSQLTSSQKKQKLSLALSMSLESQP